MAVRKIKWSSLLHLTELEFIPEAPKILDVSDELTQSLSWLTAATKHDRRLVRCTEQGAMLVAAAWSGLLSVETIELAPTEGLPALDKPSEIHKGVLIATSDELVKISFVRIKDETATHYYVPPASYYWFPHSVYSVTANVVPAVGGTSSSVGVTYFN